MTSPFERPGPATLPPLPRSLRRIALWIVAAVFIALIVVPWLASFITDWLWFKEIGFQTVFATSLVWRIGLFVLGGAFAFAYFYRNVITLPPRPASAKPRAARHLGGLLAFCFVLLAVRHWIAGTSDLLFSTTGPLVGASYTDVHVALPGLYFCAIAALLAAGWIVLGVARDRMVWSTVSATAVYLVISVLARGIVPAAFQKLVVSPNELTRETPYIRIHIDA